MLTISLRADLHTTGCLSMVRPCHATSHRRRRPRDDHRGQDPPTSLTRRAQPRSARSHQSQRLVALPVIIIFYTHARAATTTPSRRVPYLLSRYYFMIENRTINSTRLGHVIYKREGKKETKQKKPGVWYIVLEDNYYELGMRHTCDIL